MRLYVSGRNCSGDGHFNYFFVPYLEPQCQDTTTTGRDFPEDIF